MSSFPKILLLMEREKANPGWELVLGASGLDQGISQDHSVGITDLEFQGWSKKSISGLAERANPAWIGSVDFLCLIKDVGWEKE